MQKRTVGILIFDDVEVLDFAGPFEVFGVAGRRDGSDPFDVITVAEKSAPISARNRLVVTPSHSFADCPHLDVLVVPGGYGTRREMHNETVVDFVRQRAGEAEIVLSVCTGALILGRAGLLDGMPATTHHGAVELLKEVAPAADVQGDRRVIDNGRIVVAAGVASGIDAAFHVLTRLLSRAAAEETAHYMEYPVTLQSYAAELRQS